MARTRVALIIAAFSLLAPALGEAASVTLDWDSNTDGVTAGYYVYYGTEPGKYTGNVDVGSSTTAIVNLNDPNATYYFAIQAYSTAGDRSPMSAELMLKQSDSTSPLAPTLLNPGSMTTVLGQSVIMQLSASDPGGLALTYSANGLPSGVALGASGAIFGAPSVPGVYNVTVSVTNTSSLSASQTFTWTILGQPSSPAPGGGLPGGGGGTGGSGSGTGGGSTVTDPGFGGGTPVGGGTPTSPAPVPAPVPAPDVVAPTVIVSSPSPAGGSSRTINSKIIVTGTASDNVGVLSVTWANSRGGSGAALGTSSWATGPVELQMGDNVITITAVDAAGNAQSVSVTVTRYVDLENHLN